MLWSVVIIFGIVAFVLFISIILIIKKFFGISGVIFFAVTVGFLLGGAYIGNRLFNLKSPSMYCGDSKIGVYVFSKDTLRGTKIRANDFHLAPYPTNYLMEINVTDNNLNSVEGKILCIDAYKGQMLLRTMVENCSP